MTPLPGESAEVPRHGSVPLIEETLPMERPTPLALTFSISTFAVGSSWAALMQNVSSWFHTCQGPDAPECSLAARLLFCGGINGVASYRAIVDVDAVARDVEAVRVERREVDRPVRVRARAA